MKRIIFESLNYIDKKKTVSVDGVSVSIKKIFKKDASSSNYSLHLSEILDAVNEHLDDNK